MQKSKGNGQFWSVQNVGGNERNTQTNNVADNVTPKNVQDKRIPVTASFYTEGKKAYERIRETFESDIKSVFVMQTMIT